MSGKCLFYGLNSMSSELCINTQDSLHSDLSVPMCDACGEKLRFVGKKVPSWRAGPS